MTNDGVTGGRSGAGGGDRVDRAIAWHLRLNDASVEEWRAFSAWLAADPANAAAYDRIALDDAALPAGAIPVPDAANDDHPRLAYVPPAPPASPARPRRGLWAAGIGTLAAAALVAMLAVPRDFGRPDLLVVETKPGEPRRLRLADGTEVALNGGSRLLIDRAQPRLAMLDRGQALFGVVHDPAHPFELHSGGVVLRDVGTRFDVTREGARLSVQVGEGAVLFQPDAERVMLRAGAALALREDRREVVVSRVPGGDVGAWRRGRLAFHGQPLALVAAALRRSTGAELALADGLGAQPFTGSFAITGGAAAAVPRLAALIGARWRRTPTGWLLRPGPDATP